MVRSFGTREHMLLVFKIYFEQILKHQKNWIKIPHIHLDILYAYDVVLRKTDVFYVVCKNR